MITGSSGLLSFSSACAVLLLSCGAVVLLRAFGFKGAPIVSAIAILLFMNESSEAFFEIASFFDGMSAYADVSGFAEPCLKIIGVGYLGGISSDVCREIGEGGVAKFITYAERIEMILIATPYIRESVALSIEILGG